MKISSSSSMLIASLALSASSPSLAAPTDNNPNFLPTSLMSSSSKHDMNTYLSGREVGDTLAEKRLAVVDGEIQATHEEHERRMLMKRNALLKGLLCGLPILGDPICGLIKAGCGLLGAEAIGSAPGNDGDIPFEQMAAIRAAAIIAANAIRQDLGTPSPAPTSMAGAVTSAPSKLMPTGSSIIAAAPTPSTTPVLIASMDDAPGSQDNGAGPDINAQSVFLSVDVSMTVSGLGVGPTGALPTPTGLPITPTGLPVKPPAPSLPVAPPSVPSPPTDALPVSPPDLPIGH
ncbi:hypothetical protein HGRIS_002034 [Hohenbuehelia grisea]|uniref:Uncharacterized protein n=1 Tax=Hohenbuehelia grisea TaxID=104357 RepID=A0ABR3JKF3_9AGAR